MKRLYHRSFLEGTLQIVPEKLFQRILSGNSPIQLFKWFAGNSSKNPNFMKAIGLATHFDKVF